jgi:hypothetical protein
MLLVLAGVWSVRTDNLRTARRLDWIAAVAGGWLMIAPFLLGTPKIAAGLWNDIIVGGIVLVLGTWAALAPPRGAG